MKSSYQLKLRQVCLFFIAFLPVTKFFMMPSVFATYANEDMWLCCLINLAFDFAAIFSVLMLSKKYDKTFIQTLCDVFGKKTAKAVLFIYALAFLFKGILPVIEQKDYITLSLYSTDPSVYYFIPFVLAAFYIATKKLRAVGRAADIFWVFTVLGFLFMLALSVSNAEFKALLPIGANGFDKILSGSAHGYIWFGDGIYFVFMLGNFKREKHTALKISVFFAIYAIITLLFTIVFYGVFTSISFRQKFALTETSKYMSVINNLGRFDYLGITCILLSNIVAISLPFLFACKLIDYVFNIKNTYISPLFVTVFTVALLTVFNRFNYTFEQTLMNSGSILSVFGLLVPIGTLIISRRKNAKTFN